MNEMAIPLLNPTNQGKLVTYDYYTDLPNTLTMGAIYIFHSKNLIKTASIQSGGTTETATAFL